MRNFFIPWRNCVASVQFICFPFWLARLPVQYGDRVSVGREPFRPAADLLMCFLDALEFNDCQDAADTTPHLFANIGTRSRVSLRIARRVVEVEAVAEGWEFSSPFSKVRRRAVGQA
jgi:hypothetical protein